MKFGKVRHDALSKYIFSNFPLRSVSRWIKFVSNIFIEQTSLSRGKGKRIVQSRTNLDDKRWWVYSYTREEADILDGVLLTVFEEGGGWKPLKFSLERAVFVSDLVPYKNLIPRTDYTYCGRYAAVKVLSGRGVAGRRTIPRTLSHPAYLPANATYKHQFNVWNLSKWISLGSYRWPSFFFPRRIWSWCEISLYYCFARLVSHSCGKWTLFTDLFNDNYFFFPFFFFLLFFYP